MKIKKIMTDLVLKIKFLTYEKKNDDTTGENLK